MSAMDKVNNILGKLPFVKLAGNIPEGIRGKIPVLNTFIPFANHIAVILAAVVLAACFGGGGGGVASPNDFLYKLVDDFDKSYCAKDENGGFSLSDGIYINGYSGNGGRVIIPATIEGYPVRHIEALSNENRITELVIPENVEAIGGSAFRQCRNLKTLTLPASLKYISDLAFGDCVELENITIPASASFKCGDMVFVDCEKLPLKTRALLEELGNTLF